MKSVRVETKLGKGAPSPNETCAPFSTIFLNKEEEWRKKGRKCVCVYAIYFMMCKKYLRNSPKILDEFFYNEMHQPFMHTRVVCIYMRFTR